MGWYKSSDWERVVKMADAWREEATRFVYDPALYQPKNLGTLTIDLMRLCDVYSQIDPTPFWLLQQQIEVQRGQMPLGERVSQKRLESMMTECMGLFHRLVSLGTTNIQPKSTEANSVCKWQFQPGQAIYNGTVIQVNGISWNLLKAFVESDKALTETELIDAGWGHDSDKETKTLQNALSTLRFRLRKSLSLADDQDPIPSVDSGANRAWALADCLR